MRAAAKAKEPRPERAPELPRMAAEDAHAQLERVYLLVPFLNELKLEELAREFSIYDSTAALFDPTGWMRKHKDVEKNRDIVAALLRAKNAIAKVLA